MSSEIQKVCVIGAGTMGAGIAAQVANAGVPVLLLDSMGPRPMVSGLQPEIATDLMRARIGRPCSLAYSSLVTSTALAPSVSGEDVPAVTVPFWSNAGFSPPSASAVVPGRGVPSVSTVPFLVAIGMISSVKWPASIAAAALSWLRAANWSCSSRLSP